MIEFVIALPNFKTIIHTEDLKLVRSTRPLDTVIFSRSPEKSDLTVDALKLHNELQAGTLERGAGDRGDACMEETAEQALSERSAGTFLSGLSDCSNLTFRKVQRFWESNSAAHKEVCNSGGAVLF
jgi:hypothetical protein